MNLQPLFEAQKKLDEHIEKSKGLEGQNLLDKKILALQVELGELANEFRGFKYWSEDQEPRTYGFYDDKDCEYCNGTGTVREHPSDTGYGCPDCEGSGFMHYNPLLEEYVDCLHFILSIGLESKKTTMTVPYDRGWIMKLDSITTQLNYLFDKVGNFHKYKTTGNYAFILDSFLGLGELLGFTWEQIEQAYFAKNEENHRRQENGY